MKIGGVWKGADGTVYRVISAVEVKVDQPRWWIDQDVLDGDRMCGPTSPARLHTISLAVCNTTASLALVSL